MSFHSRPVPASSGSRWAWLFAPIVVAVILDVSIEDGSSLSLMRPFLWMSVALFYLVLGIRQLADAAEDIRRQERR